MKIELVYFIYFFSSIINVCIFPSFFLNACETVLGSLISSSKLFIAQIEKTKTTHIFAHFVQF